MSLTYTLREREYRECGSPMRGDNLTRDTVSMMKKYDECYRATLFALRSLSLCDSSATHLLRKLLARGISAEIAKSTVDEMRSLGYIDEARQLEKIITDLVNKSNMGRYKITSRLMAKGYSAREINRAISELSARGEIDFSLAEERLLNKYPELSSDEKRKILYKNGYTNA